MIIDIFLSADGWAGSTGLPPYFGYVGPELDAWIKGELAKPQVMLMGRGTYEMLSALPEEARDESWHRMTELEKVVFSSSLDEADWPNTRLSDVDLVAEVSRMKAESDVPLRTIGSLSLARQLMDAKLVDRLRLMTFPLIAGPDGRDHAFKGMAAADLELVDHRALDGSILLVEYRPTGRDIPRS